MPDEKLQITKIKNPFNKFDRDVSFAEYKNESLLALRNQHFPQDMDVVVSVNGSIIPKEEWPQFYPVKGDYISLIPVVESDVLKIIAGIVLIVIGIIYPVTGPYLIPAGIGLIIGGVAGMLTPKRKTPALPSLEDYESSQTYRWNPQTVQQQGLAIPKAYGINKLYGNIIAANLENIGDKYYLNALLCLGIGPYKRLYDFKLNDQPAENFQGVTIQARMGNLNQSIISNFNNTKAEFQTSVKIVNPASYTYLTNNAAFDGLEIEVTFPQGLYYANDQGGLDAYSVNMRVEIRKQGDAAWIPITHQVLTTSWTVYNNKWSGGVWEASYEGAYPDIWHEYVAGDTNPYSHTEGASEWVVIGYDANGYPINQFLSWRWITTSSYIKTASQTVDYITVTGAQNSAIRRTFKADNLPHGKYEIRVTNLSADQTSSRYADDMYLSAVREVYYDDFEYPRHVLVGINALATDQLSGSLRFSCLAECAHVRIWNGTSWSVNISNNPAWVFLDIMTQPVFDNNLNVLRYDGYNISYFDLTKLKEWADFCDTLVPDGLGGQEKRITFNGAFDAGTSVWEAAMQVCRVGRTAPRWTGTTLTLFIDKPEEPSQMFTIGNIGVDSFEEVFLPQSGRAMEIEIDYVNADKDYTRDICSVINPNINSDIEKVNLNLFGITKNSMAWRAGKYYLAYNEFLKRTITFKAYADAITSTVGNVVLVQHDVPQWGFGGRLVAATANTVTLDREVTIEAGKTYAILVRLSDDSRVQKTVANSPGTYTTLTLSSAFTAIPAQYDIYSFGETNLVTKPFRITDIQPSQDLQFTISAIEYNASIYNSDLEQPVLPTANYSSLKALPSVTNLAVNEKLIKEKNTIKTVLDIYFAKPISSFWQEAEIWSKISRGVWKYEGISFTGYYQIQNASEATTYTIKAISKNIIGQKEDFNSAPEISLYVYGKTTKPSDVSELWGQASIGGLRLNWTSVDDVDLDYYKIRFTVSGSAWDNALDIATTNGTSITLPAAKSGKYMIKAVDTSGNESVNTKELITNIPSILSWNVKETLIENPAWTGAKTDMFVENGKLISGSAEMFDSSGLFDKDENFDYGGGVAGAGYYETQAVNLGSVQTARCSANIQFDTVNELQLWDDGTDLVDSNEMVDGDTSGAGVILQIALSQNGTTWGDWQNFFMGDYTAKAFKFRAKAYSNAAYQYVRITSLTFNVDMPDRDESGQDVTIPSGGQTITFALPFMVKPKIGITLQSANAGDYYDLQSVNVNNFTVQIKNSSGVGIQKTIDWEAKRY